MFLCQRLNLLLCTTRFEQYQATFAPIEEAPVSNMSYAVLLVMSSRNMPHGMEIKALVDSKTQLQTRMIEALEATVNEQRDDWEDVVKKASAAAVEGGVAGAPAEYPSTRRVSWRGMEV